MEEIDVAHNDDLIVIWLPTMHSAKNQRSCEESVNFSLNFKKNYSYMRVGRHSVLVLRLPYGLGDVLSNHQINVFFA